MRLILLTIGGAFLITGCSSTDQRGEAPKEYILTENGTYGWESEERLSDPRTSAWSEGWRRTGGPDRIAPMLPLDPLFPPAPPR